MAQGGLKKSGGKFAPVKPKSSRKDKPLGPKKRGQRIAPKRAKSVQALKQKKELQKAINQGIEQEITQRAKEGGTEFRVLNKHTSSSSSSSSSFSSSSSSSSSNKDSTSAHQKK